MWLLWTLVRRCGDRICGGKSQRVERVVGLPRVIESGFRGKYYAVRRGYRPGLYLSWADCEQQVRGYRGAQFKGFWVRKEAEIYLGSTLS